MAKFQIVVTLACGEKVKSQGAEYTQQEKQQTLELLEYASKDDLNYMKFTRDTGSVVYISKDALRAAKTFELVEIE